MIRKKNQQTSPPSPLDERTLSMLFDYQKFENDPLLERLIHETESLYDGEISDDDLSQINAAGEIAPARKRQDSEGDTV